MIRADSPEDQVHVAKIYETSQGHIFDYWDELGPGERKQLLAQIASFDHQELQRLVSTLVTNADAGPEDDALAEYSPPDEIELSASAAATAERVRATEIGWEAIRAGEVGVFLVAGGQGTRLRFDGPKGLFPVGPVTDRTLFQIFAEKIKAIGREARQPLSWFIMTSEENDEATREAFRKHRNFGLSSNQIVFQKQGMLPVVDKRGKILMRSKSEIVLSPDGHGATVRVIRSLRDVLAQRGVKYLFYLQVDNPMIHLCDPAFIGYHILRNSQFSSKAVSKEHPDEKLGVFCKRGQRLVVVEYSELGERERHLRDERGRLVFRAGNLANHVISVDFICPEDPDIQFEMPYHVARKVTPHVRNGEVVTSKEPNSIKFEAFLFDVLGYTHDAIVIEADRREYAPIKNLEGDCSPETCRRSLTEEYASWLEAAGVAVPRDESGNVRGRIEISPLFANSGQSLKERLNGREIVFEDPLVLP